MCERNGRFIKPCESIVGCCSAELRNLVNRETHERTTDRIVLRHAAHKGGIAVNFCPFTGTDLRTWEDEPRPEGPGQDRPTPIDKQAEATRRWHEEHGWDEHG